MSKVIIFAHPNEDKSVANKTLLESVVGKIEVHKLYTSYADGKINVSAEHEILNKYDHIILQFPFYWYSSPSLLKQWLDDVLIFGFAYGADGSKLANKTLQVAITTGGDAQAYSAEGYNSRDVKEYLYPLEQTAKLCQMKWAEPIISLGAGVLMRGTEEEKSAWLKSAVADYTAKILG